MIDEKMKTHCLTCDKSENCKDSIFSGGVKETCGDYSSDWENEPLVWVGPDGATDRELYAKDND